MNKYVGFVICLIMIFSLTGCNDDSDNPYVKPGNQSASVNDVLKSGMSETDGKSGQIESKETSESVTDPDKRNEPVIDLEYEPEQIDVDLTELSGTMVYSEVYNIMSSPDEYIGKTVKMKGLFAHYYDETTDTHYFACIIKDATACCSQGIEFVLTDDYIYPDDYPKTNEEICVVGVFDTYKEGQRTYCTLRNAELL